MVKKSDLKYLFSGKPVDVGLSSYGNIKAVGPLIASCVFLPAETHEKTLLWYDINYKGMWTTDTARD